MISFVVHLSGQPLLSARRAALAALAKIDIGMRGWLSDKCRGTSVVLGNHPIDVRPTLKP